MLLLPALPGQRFILALQPSVEVRERPAVGVLRRLRLLIMLRLSALPVPLHQAADSSRPHLKHRRRVKTVDGQTAMGADKLDLLIPRPGVDNRYSNILLRWVSLQALDTGRVRL